MAFNKAIVITKSVLSTDAAVVVRHGAFDIGASGLPQPDRTGPHAIHVVTNHRQRGCSHRSGDVEGPSIHTDHGPRLTTRSGEFDQGCFPP